MFKKKDEQGIEKCNFLIQPGHEIVIFFVLFFKEDNHHSETRSRSVGERAGSRRASRRVERSAKAPVGPTTIRSGGRWRRDATAPAPSGPPVPRRRPDVPSSYFDTHKQMENQRINPKKKKTNKTCPLEAMRKRDTRAGAIVADMALSTSTSY